MEFLEYDFILNAIIAGLLVSAISGIIGSLIVVNRMVFLAGGIAHAAYGGVGIAVFFGIPILLGASLFSILCALAIGLLAVKAKNNLDNMIGLIWALGMAVGIILIDLTPGYQVDFMSYLFGSILSVENDDLIFMTLLLFVVIGLVGYYYQDFLAISYDLEFAKLRGINVNLFSILLLILAALTIVISIRVVGLILVIALLTIPTYIASMYASSLLKMMVLSGFLSMFFTLIGLYLSYEYDLSSGATIILVCSIGLILSYLLKGKLFSKNTSELK